MTRRDRRGIVNRALGKLRFVRVVRHVDALAKGPRLIAARCQSGLDDVLLGLFSPGVAPDLLTPPMSQRPVPRWPTRAIHALAIKPSRSMLLKDVVRHVRDGDRAVIFPKGEVTPVATVATDRKSTRLNSSHIPLSRMPSSA